MTRWFLLIVALLLVTACSGSPAVQPEPADQATTAPSPTPVAASPTPTPAADPPPTQTSQPTTAPTATASPTTPALETPTLAPTAEEPAESVEAAAAETNWLAVEGKTEANLTYLGNPDAPVTIIDYSDFL
jgi:protein-disulfide isomerase